jgi:hypothetical protein
MAFQPLKGAFCWPEFPRRTTAAPSITGYTLNALNEKLAAVTQVPRSGDISKVAFKLGTVVAAQNLTIRLETVDMATGFPTGTLWAANTQLDPVVIAAADDNHWKTATLTAAAGVLLGEYIGIVVTHKDNDTDSLDVLTFTDHPGNFPYSLHDAGAGYVKNQNAPMFALEYSSGDAYSWIPGVLPYANHAGSFITTAFASNSNPDEIGLRFQVPMACKVIGAWVWGILANNYEIKLYDDAGTLLASLAVAGAGLGGTTAADPYLLLLNAETELTINTWYRLTVLPTTTSNVTVYEWTVPTTSLLNAFGMGVNCHRTSRNNGGSFVDTATTTRVFMGVLISAVSDDVVVSSGAPKIVDQGMLFIPDPVAIGY